MPKISAITLFLLLTFLPCNDATATEFRVTVTFSDTEISVISSYYREHIKTEKSKGKPKKALPPGIEKNLAWGKPLPPGIAKQMLPGDLIAGLPPVPDGFERIIVAGKVLLVEIATQVVHDILEDLLFD